MLTQIGNAIYLKQKQKQIKTVPGQIFTPRNHSKRNSLNLQNLTSYYSLYETGILQEGTISDLSLKLPLTLFLI